MNVYKVEYVTAWQGDYREKDEKRVVAKNASAAIEKAQKLVGKEKGRGEDKSVLHRVLFELEAVSIITHVDG